MLTRSQQQHQNQDCSQYRLVQHCWYYNTLLNIAGWAPYVLLKAENSKQFRIKFKDAAYLIMDEVVNGVLSINKILCELKDTSSVLFGGLSVIVLGDQSQCTAKVYWHQETRELHKYIGIMLTSQDKLMTEHPEQNTYVQANQQILTVKHYNSVPSFDVALRTFPTRKQVNEYNTEYLALLTSPRPHSIPC